MVRLKQWLFGYHKRQSWWQGSFGVSLLGIVMLGGLSGCDKAPQEPRELQEDLVTETSSRSIPTIQSDELPKLAELSKLQKGSTSSVDQELYTSLVLEDAFISPHLQANLYQTIAQTPNCQFEINEDSAMSLAQTANTLGSQQCRYLELNTLLFSPSQPWLENIMWKTIAQHIAPETSLSGEKDIAKTFVRMLLRQVKGQHKGTVDLPVYQFIQTNFYLNKNQTGYFNIASVQQRFNYSPRLDYVYYAMVDMANNKQLSLKDILKEQYVIEDLLSVLQKATKKFDAQPALTDKIPLPIDFPAQWYLDGDGLHLLYQPGEIVDMDMPALKTDTVAENLTERKASSEPDRQNEIVELYVPYTLIQPLLKPRYVINTTKQDSNNNHDTDNKSKAVIEVRHLSY